MINNNGRFCMILIIILRILDKKGMFVKWIIFVRLLIKKLKMIENNEILIVIFNFFNKKWIFIYEKVLLKFMYFFFFYEWIVYFFLR